MEALFTCLEGTAREFREKALLQELLARQAPEGRKLLALLQLFQLPADRPTVEATAGELSAEPHLGRALALGLAERSPEPAGEGERFFVSAVLEPLLVGEASEEELAEAAGRASRHLAPLWWENSGARTEPRLLELHRLALRAGELKLAADVAMAVGNNWINRSRFREAARLCARTLELGEEPRVVHALARASYFLGDSAAAAQLYERAAELGGGSSAIGSEAGRREQATLLHNSAVLHAQQGRNEEAFELYRQSLEINEQIGDVQGQAATLHALAGLHAQQGRVEEAFELYRQSLEIKERIGDVQGQAATLHQMAGLHAQQGRVEEAFELYRQSLEITGQTGDVQGQAATLHQMGRLHAQQGRVEEAFELYRQSLEIKERIGDAQGQAATLHQMGRLHAQQGRVEEAFELYRQSLEIEERIGDVQGQAATLHQMAGLHAQQGRVEEAFELYRQVLEIDQQTGDAQGQAATLHQMAVLHAQQGRLEEAFELFRQSLEITEQIGNVQGQATTLAGMGFLAWKQGNGEECRRRFEEAARILASVGAWPDLFTVLGNLSVVVPECSVVYLAQIFWLALRVAVGAEDLPNRLQELLAELDPVSEVALRVAAAGPWLVARQAAGHPERERLIGEAMGPLAWVARARGLELEGLRGFLEERGLSDPARLLPWFERDLEGLVPEGGWMFDRTRLAKLVG
ncbi:MAG: tetratricopeptide repeat protein [Thermoanaerobaculia bacterium]